MEEQVNESKKMHADIYIYIDEHLAPQMPHYSNFMIAAKSIYVSPTDVARSKTATDILTAMERKGHLEVGQYDKLIELLDRSHLQDIKTEVEQRADEIRNQIDLETAGPTTETSKSGPADGNQNKSRAGPPTKTSKSTPVKGGQAKSTGIDPSPAVTDKVRQVKEKSDLCSSHSRTNIRRYVETTQCKKTKEVFELQNSLLLIGTSGSGKSFILHHMSANPLPNYFPISCKRPKEIWKYLDLVRGTDIQLLFVVDEPFGSSYVQSALMEEWMNECTRLEMYLGKHKFVFATRQSVWNDCKVHLEKSPFFVNTVEVTSAKLTVEDKNALLHSYLGGGAKLTGDEIDTIVNQKNPIAYGQCCQLLSEAADKGQTGADLVQIFLKPFSYLSTELEKMADKDKEKYATLCLVMLCNGELECNQLRVTPSDVKPDVKDIIDDVVVVFKGPKLTPGDLYESAQKLTGTHLEKRQATTEDSTSCLVYKFTHDSIEEAVTMHYGERHPEHCLKYLKPAVVVNSARPHHYEKREQEFAINFPPENYKKLAGIFTTKVIDENETYRGLSKVFDNPCVKDELFQSVWVDYLISCSPSERTAFTQSKDRDGRCVLYHLAVSGAHTVLSYLCPDRQYTCKCDRYLPCVLEGAVYGNHEQLLSRYLTAHTLDRGDAGRAVGSVCQYDRVHLLPVLFAHSSVQYHPYMVKRGLETAGRRGHVRLVDYILTHHCTPCTGPHCPCVTGLLWASVGGHTDIVTMIITSHGQNVNTPVHYDGSTSLHKAALCGRIDVVKFLLSAGADINTRTRDGKTSLDLAVERYRTNVVEFLRSNGGQ